MILLKRPFFFFLGVVESTASLPFEAVELASLSVLATWLEASLAAVSQAVDAILRLANKACDRSGVRGGR